MPETILVGFRIDFAIPFRMFVSDFARELEAKKKNKRMNRQIQDLIIIDFNANYLQIIKRKKKYPMNNRINLITFNFFIRNYFLFRKKYDCPTKNPK